MADEVVGSARVIISPDTTGFDSALLNDLRSALDSATDAIAGAFRDAALQASTALADIGDTGFDSTATAAESAASSIEATFASTAANASTELAGIGEGASETIGTEFDSAATAIESSLTSAADAGTAALSDIGAGAGDALVSEMSSAADSVAADLASIGDDIPAIELEVTADTSSADDALASLGDTAAESNTGVSDLSDGVDDLTAATEGAGAGAGGLESAVGLLGNTATATGGSFKSLGSSIGGIVPEATPVIGTVGAIVGVLGTFVGAGIKSSEANDRFTRTFGPLEGAIRDINIGNLNGDLETLAARLGSSDEELENAASRLFTLGQASGATNEQVEKTTEQFIALALRTKALNPGLGETGDLANKLFAAAAKSGKGLASLNLSVSKTEIETRALAIAQERGADAFSTYDKQVATAQILTERYGDTLNQAFEEGEKSPAVRIGKLRQEFTNLTQDLGQELVIPALDALEALEPLGLGIVSVLGGIASAVTPLLTTLDAISPAIGLVGAALGALGQAVSTIANLAGGAGLGFALLAASIALPLAPLTTLIGLAAGAAVVVSAIFNHGDAERRAFAKEVKEATEALKDQNGVVQVTTDAIAGYIESTSRFADNGVVGTQALGLLGVSLEQVGEFAKQGKQGLDNFHDALEASSDGSNVAKFVIRDLEKSLKETEAVVNETARASLAAAAVTDDLADSYLKAGKASGNYTEQLDAYRIAEDQAAQAALTAATSTGEVTAAQRDAALASNTAASGAVDYSNALKLVNEQLVVSQAAQDGFNTSFAGLSDRLPRLRDSFLAMHDTIGTFDVDMAILGQHLTDAGVTVVDFQTVATGLGVTTEQLHTFVDGVSSAIGEFVSSAVSKLPSVSQAFEDAAGRAKEAGRALSAVDIRQSLEKQLADIQSFNVNLRKLIEAGFSDVAAFAAQSGPAAVAALAKSIGPAGDTTTLTALRTSLLPQISQGLTEATNLIAGNLGPQFVAETGAIAQLAGDTFGPNFNPSQFIVPGMANATTAITQGAVPLVAAATTAADTAKQNFAQRWGLLPSVTAAGVTGATNAIAQGGGPLAGAANSAANAASGGFATGLVPGLAAGAKAGMSAAAANIDAGAKVIASVNAYVAGFKVGQSFDQGIAAGISDAKSVAAISAAAAAAVRAAEAAARREAKSASPSKLFAALGLDLGRGIAVGFDQSESAVVQAAEAIVRAAASATAAGSLTSPGVFGGAAGGSVGVGALSTFGQAQAGGGSGNTFNVSVAVNVDGTITTADARAIGAVIGNAVNQTLSQGVVSRQAAIDTRINRGR